MIVTRVKQREATRLSRESHAGEVTLRRRAGSHVTVFVRSMIALLALGAAASFSGCSFLIDKNARQCERDSDCHAGSYSSCQRGVCVDPARPSGAGAAGCLAATGCFRCVPEAGNEFLNACTDASCVPFDNATRLEHWAADGKLRPLP